MRDRILELLKEIRPDVDFENEHSLIDDGVIESFDVIQIAGSMMDEFGIFIDADDIEPENLNSLDQIYEMIKRKIQGT